MMRDQNIEEKGLKFMFQRYSLYLINVYWQREGGRERGKGKKGKIGDFKKIVIQSNFEMGRGS